MAALLPHNFNRNVLHWRCCCWCGLILLRNKATEKAARKLCPGSAED